MFRSSRVIDPITINSKVSSILKEYSVQCVDFDTSQQLLDKFVSSSEDPFFVIDLTHIIQQYIRWTELLPRVKPFYAVKCNPNPAIIKLINALGGGFDCASKAEIQLVQSLGVAGHNIIFANPCKQRSHIRYALKSSVNVTTFDNKEELVKINKVAPESKLLLRIITDDSKSVCQLGDKFGAAIEDCGELLKTAYDYGLDVIGVSFHVGSGCRDANAFSKALYSAHYVFEKAREQGFEPTVLDIGGGFPGTDDTEVTFKQIASVISPLLDKLFKDVDIIAEPGRYFAAGSHSLFCNVIAKRECSPSEQGQPEILYYINDGLYQSFNCIIFDHAQIQLEPVNNFTSKNSWKNCRVFGPSCDALDCIAKNIKLPLMEVGDWICVPNFGAYTVSAASKFNGFKTNSMIYVYKKTKFIE